MFVMPRKVPHGRLFVFAPIEIESSSLIVFFTLFSEALIIPLVEVSAFQVLDNGNGGTRFTQQVGGAVPAVAPSEGADLLNLGAANDELYATVGIGVQSSLTDEMTLGIAYEVPISETGDNLTQSRLTVDLSYNF